MSQTEHVTALSDWLGPGPAGAALRVYQGILVDLDIGRLVPGQRLIETDFAQRFKVGRNSVREAMLYLAGRGVIDLSPNRSPAIRRLDLLEVEEVLEVAEMMTRLVARAAAVHCRPEDKPALQATLGELATASAHSEAGEFNRARRNFYRSILLVGRNRELQRLFPAVGTHILHAQYPSPRIQAVRLADYCAMARAIMANDTTAAETAAVAHVNNVRAIILELALSTSRRCAND